MKDYITARERVGKHSLKKKIDWEGIIITAVSIATFILMAEGALR